MIENQYRTFWKRFFAGFVDGLVLLPISLFTNWIWSHHQGVPNVLLALLYLVTHLIYYAYDIYFLGKYGQTLGKMALKVKVLDVSEQQHVTYLQALRRDIVPLAVSVMLLPYDLYQIIVGKFYLMNPGTMPGTPSMILVYVFMGWFLLEIITMMFSSKRRALHDFIAGSVVVKYDGKFTMNKETIQRVQIIFLIFFLIGCLVVGGMFAPSCGEKGDLRHAAYKGDLARVNALIAAKADVNAQHKNGGTALMWASSKGHIEVVRALLAAKADVNARDGMGETALMKASFKGHVEVVRTLLTAKADVNAKDKDGSTALMWASVGGNIEVVRTLLAAKANVNTKNNNGITALMNSSFRGYVEVMRALLAAKADVNAKDKDGSTALMWAQKNKGITALIWPQQGNQVEVVKLLKQAGATE